MNIEFHGVIWDNQAVSHPQANIQNGVATLPKTRVKEPHLYNVILLNDDYTTMEFVVMVIQRYFYRTLAEATRIMLSVHQQGKAVCGLYPYDIAATKLIQVTDFARKNEMPLKCVMERI